MTTITRLGHSHVMIDGPGGRLAVDPGGFSDLTQLARADAILVTHGHPDHADVEALAKVTTPVWAPADLAGQLIAAGVRRSRVHPIATGESTMAAGFAVDVLGGEHAMVHPDLPRPRNNAYLIDGTILHPGDAFPLVYDPTALELVLLPVAAPWLRIADAIEFARGFPQARFVPIHDAILSDAGRGVVDRILAATLGAARYQRPADGESVEI